MAEIQGQEITAKKEIRQKKSLLRIDDAESINDN
jgi:hypothetical protein